MKNLLPLLLLAVPVVAFAAPENYTPPWQSYQETGNVADIITSPTVAKAIGGKVDAVNGQSDSQTLTNANVGGKSVNLYSGTPLVSCPVGACPGLSNPQLAHSAFQQYAVSSLDKNWEFGGIFGILDTTGGGNGSAVDQTDAAKMGLYSGIMQTPSGGPGWALNTNAVRCAYPGSENSIPGYAGAGTACTSDQQGTMDKYSSTIGYELDVSNFDQDSNGLPPDTPFVVGEYITTTSFYSGWAGLFFGIGQGQTADAWHNGILFSSPNSGGGRTVSENTILDLSSSDVGYHSQGTHKTAGWYDESTGNYGLWIAGTKAVEDIDLSTTTPVGIGINGARSAAGVHLNVSPPSGSSNSGILDTGSHNMGQSYDDQSTSAVGIKAEGTYSYAAFSAQQANTKIALTAAKGQGVCFNNSDHCVTWDGNTLVYSIGSTRMFAIDNNGNLSIKGTLTQNGVP